MSDKNKDFQVEQSRVEFVKKEIEKKKEKLSESVSSTKEKVIELRKNFWEDVTVNVEELDDVIETEASIKQQAELLSERERSHRQRTQQLKILNRLLDSPYFGRIDFLEDGEKDVDPIYIGIASFMDEKDENFLIYDWRAPISSLYYDYPPGPAEYETVEGKIKGDMKLKRQFIIRGGSLKGMFETGLTIGDHLLQQVLGHNASTMMKSIVATIQREQNQIIRNDKAKLLIVQGVAGSGKTSAAMQRVAFLLYRYRGSLTSENIILFSPNPIFTSYVSSVLPELGEENMKQMTFQEHVDERLGKQFHLESPFDQMEYYLTKKDEEAYRIRISAIRFKASEDFKTEIDRYIQFLGNEGIVFRNITFRNQRIISKEEIHDYFYSHPKSMSIPSRLEMVSKWLLEQLTHFEKRERKKDWVLEEVNLLSKSDFLKAYQTLDLNSSFSEDTFDDFEREEKLLRKWVVARRLKPLNRKIENFDFVNIKEMYIHFFEQFSPKKRHSKYPTNWQDVCNFTIETIKNGDMFYEDNSPYLYFFDRIQGFTVNKDIRHVLIDEAQDYSAFQFAYIKAMYPLSRITLLGDFNQAIYAHTMETGTLLSEDEHQEGERIVLTNSYRSTKEIVEFTKEIVENGEMIKPFNREGSLPRLMHVQDDDELYREIESSVHALLSKGYETVAIVCKSMEESEQAFTQLRNVLNVKLVSPKTKTYEKGIIIIPAYLAKGIEFDAVIMHNASEEIYKEESERKLFYTGCTRAMHELLLFSKGKKSPFIEGISLEKYVLVNEI